MAELRERTAHVARGGGREATDRHRARGKLTARERIALLVDPGSEFLELNALAAWGVYDDAAPAAGIVTGIGAVAGRLCVLVANDATVKAGTYFPLTVKKHLRAQEVAEQNRLPCIYLADSGGAYLPLQAEVFPDRDHFGRIFFNQARMSAQGIPQIALVVGSCTAGGAYVPAMSDEAVIVRGTGTVFIGGPPLVKAATGQDVTAEELGGADLHARRSGVVDHLADSDAHALELGRRIVAGIYPASPPSSALGNAPTPSRRARTRPSCTTSPHLRDYRQPRRGARADDASSRRAASTSSKRCTPRRSSAAGRGSRSPVGILANNGASSVSRRGKGHRRARLQAARPARVPAERDLARDRPRGRRAGLRDGAKLVTAVACAEVPKFTVVVGGSFGAGNYAMCGRPDAAALMQASNARISVMGERRGRRAQLRRKQRPGRDSRELRAGGGEPVLLDRTALG